MSVCEPLSFRAVSGTPIEILADPSGTRCAGFWFRTHQSNSATWGLPGLQWTRRQMYQIAPFTDQL